MCGAFGSTGATRRGMLEVLEHAQGAGAKAQLDAQIGQGSIFDLGPADGGASPFAAPAHPPIPIHEFERTELLAREKESIGLFISDHPLKRVREALRAKADCACAEVMDRKDGEFVKRRRHDHGVQEDPHARGLDADVRHARRPRGRGRADGVREDARHRRGGAPARRDRDGQGPRRPQGGRQGHADRAGRRALRPLGRRDRAGPRAGRQGRRAAQAAAPDARGRAACRSRCSTSCRRIIEDFPGEHALLELHDRRADPAAIRQRATRSQARVAAPELRPPARSAPARSSPV